MVVPGTALEVSGGDKAVLHEMSIDVKPKGITTDKIKDGAVKTFLITDGSSIVKWAGTDDPDVQEIIKFNETVTTLTDNGDGTFTYRNEADIKDNLPGVTFDANTLTITQRPDGVFVFINKAGDIIGEINVSQEVINNITTILGDTVVQEEVYNTVANQGKNLVLGDALEFTTGDGLKTLLFDAAIGVMDKGITTEKIANGGDKTILITDGNSTVVWASSSDPVINEIVKNNETITTLVDNGNGTFTYRNENDIKNNGAGITFDANTLRIDESRPGVFYFWSDNSDQFPLAIINTNANNIIFNDNSNIVYNNVEEAITEIINRVETIEAMKATLSGDGITINAQDELADVVLKPVTLAIKDGAVINSKLANNSVTTEKIADLSVTAHKINSETSETNSILVADGYGNANFVSVDNILISNVTHDLDLSNDGSLFYAAGNGRNVLFGSEGVTIGINTGGVRDYHILNRAVTNVKLFGGEQIGVNNRFAISDEYGTVTYNQLTPSMITQKGNLTTSGDIIDITSGDNSILSNVVLDINDKSIGAIKLDGTGKEPNAVATVNTDGTVDYKLLTESNFSSAKSLITDGSINLNSGTTTITDALLKDVQVGIATDGVKTVHIADQAVTPAKIQPAVVQPNAPSGFVLMTDQTGEVIWGEAGDILGTTAGNLTNNTENIFQFKILDPIENPTGSVLNSANGAVLKDVELSVRDNSISVRKLLTDNLDGTPGFAPNNMLLVSDGQGGIDYMSREAGNINTEDLVIQDGLVFKGNSNGVGAVFVGTTIGIQDKGISSSKLSSNVQGSNEGADMVMTADGQGGVTFTKVNNSAFDGQGKALISDSSINVVSGDNSLLSQATISIADNGVKTNHIANQQVTASKIKSDLADNNKILTADASGGAQFKSFSDIAATEGKALTSDGSLTVTGAANAVLQTSSIRIANSGIKTIHIDDKQVTETKIKSTTPNGFVLTAKDGGAEFQDISAAITGSAKDLTGTEGIEVSGANGADGLSAVLKNVEIKIKDLGVTTGKIATGAVTTEKIGAWAVNNARLDTDAVSARNIRNGSVRESHISSKYYDPANSASLGVNYEAGTVLTADGNGGVSFQRAQGGGNSDPYFSRYFYLPAIAIPLAGGSNVTLDLYDEYRRQFGTPMLKSHSSSSLTVYPVNKLKFYITYYDTAVFQQTSLSSDGKFSYRVASSPQITGNTFINVVIEVIEDND